MTDQYMTGRNEIMTVRTNYNHTLYASYLGYITQAIVNNLAPLLFLIFQNTYDIPLRNITMLITVNFLVQLIVDLISAKFVDKIGYRICIVAAHIFAAAGLAGMSVFPSVFPTAYAGLLAAAVLYAVGGGLIEVLISPIVEACPTTNKFGAMSLLHSFYCWGTVAVILVSTGFLFVFGKGSWRVLAGIWAVLPALNAVYFSKIPIAGLTEEGEGLSGKELCSMRLFWILIVLMVASGASEQAMSQWASAFAEKGLGVSKALGDLAGPCLFSVLMGSSRVLYAKYSEKVNLPKVIICCGILCIFSYLLASLAPVPQLSLLGCGLCGFSVGVFWPGVFSVGSMSCPKGGTTMFALLALAGDMGCSGGPTLVGMVSGAFGDDLKTGLLTAVVFPVLLILFILMYQKETIRERQESKYMM